MQDAAGSQSSLAQTGLAQNGTDARGAGRMRRSPPGSERRNSERLRARDLSEIIATGMSEAITCLVCNLSIAGAMIEVARSDIPQRFVLVNHARSQRALCRVVWRDGRRIGLRFLSPPRSFA